MARLTRMSRSGPQETEGRKRRILIVEDHEIVRQGLSELISREPDLELAGEAVDAPAALRALGETLPDLVVVDLSLRKGSGIDLIKQIRIQAPTVPTLVFSMHDEVLYGERALRAGAMGYVSKGQPSSEILAAIRQVLSGHTYLSQALTDRVARLAGPGSSSRKRFESLIEGLSDRELEVLEWIGRGLGSREIAQRIGLSVKTVETYRERIKSKLDLGSASELIRYAAIWVNMGN